MDVVINSLSLEDKQVMDKNINLIVEHLSALISNISDLVAKYDLNNPDTLQSVEEFIGFIKTLLQIDAIPEIIFDNDNIRGLEEFTQKSADRIGTLIEDRENIDSWFYSDVHNLDLEKVKSDIDSKKEELAKFLESSIICCFA